MHATSVDVENEFAAIEKEVLHLARALARLDDSHPEPDGQDAWEASHVCASATEKIYTGCERIMARLASEVDNAAVAHSDQWHVALLRRMANPYPGVRPAIISSRTRETAESAS